MEESGTAADYDAVAVLGALRTVVVEAGDLRALCRRMTDVAIQLLDADCASVHIKAPTRPELRLVAARGLVPEAVAWWQHVHEGSSSTCGRALSRRERIIIADVERDESLTGTEELRHMRLCGIRAVQSTPLLCAGGQPVGMLSTHWRREYQPPGGVLRSLDALALHLGPLMEHAAAAEALRASEAALRLRVAALERADREKNDFLAMLAHELRNPLAPIRNVGEVLGHVLQEQPAAGRPLAILRRQTDQLTRLVEDLLDISRIRQGRLTLEERPVELGDVVGQAVETVQPLVREKQLRLVLEPAPGPLWVLGDRARLIQCVGNLLHNAAKYTAPGGEIRLLVRESGARLSIEVADSGAGLPPALLPHVFDPFVQSGETLAHSRGGLGIGLAIVRRLIEMHGGTVEAASPGEGLGSTFTIHLWRLERSPPQPTAGAARQASRRLLVADANSDAADTLAALLRAMGHRVEVAYSALSALDAAERLRPDAVLLDLDLPRMSGYRVAQRLRAQPELAATRLIAICRREEEGAARAAGFDEHLTKPVDVAALERVLTRAAAG